MDNTKPPPRPRWVKIAGLVVVVLVVILVVGKIAGVEHGPGMHGGGDSTSTVQTVESGGHTPPDWAPNHGAPGE